MREIYIVPTQATMNTRQMKLFLMSLPHTEEESLIYCSNLNCYCWNKYYMLSC